jgi:hypothetical protein
MQSMYLNKTENCHTMREVRAHLAKYTTGDTATILLKGYDAKAVLVPLNNLPWTPTEQDMKAFSTFAWRRLRASLVALWKAAGVKIPKPNKRAIAQLKLKREHVSDRKRVHNGAMVDGVRVHKNGR